MDKYGSAKRADAEQGKGKKDVSVRKTAGGVPAAVLGGVVQSIREHGAKWLRGERRKQAEVREGEAERRAGAGETGVFRAADLARVREMVELVRRVVFPGFFDPEPVGEAGLDEHVRGLLERIAAMLREEIAAVRRYGRGGEKGESGKYKVQSSNGNEDGARGEGWEAEVVEEFLARLAGVRKRLALDVQAAYDGDPAAEHTDEVILCYPGVDAIFAHRVAHELYDLGVPVLPRVIAEQAHSRTGIDIHPGAKIGESFFIDHGSGTVIGETSVIGRNVKIYQGVTLGARSFPKDERGRVIRGIKRHPTIGDRVNLYAGAVVLGGDTVIGDDCVIAGGVFVTSSVPPGHVVQQPRADLTLRRAGSGGKGGKAGPAGERHSDVAWLEGGSGI